MWNGSLPSFFFPALSKSPPIPTRMCGIGMLGQSTRVHRIFRLRALNPRSSAINTGVRGGAAGAGSPLPGLTADENAFFRNGLAAEQHRPVRRFAIFCSNGIIR